MYWARVGGLKIDTHNISARTSQEGKKKHIEVNEL